MDTDTWRKIVQPMAKGKAEDRKDMEKDSIEMDPREKEKGRKEARVGRRSSEKDKAREDPCVEHVGIVVGTTSCPIAP
jgi:hypothetical protein